jgi:hypothetical protein
MITGMSRVSLTTIGAVSAIVTVAMFVVGIALMATSGVQVLIPETGKDGLEWIADVDDAGDLFVVGAWFVVFGGLVGLVALIGFYEALRGAGPAMILAPILGVASMTLVTISHVLPIALAYDFVPGYLEADAAARASLEVTFDTLASLSLALNYAGDEVAWGVVVPLYAYAILKTRVVSPWIGWLGFVAAFFAGWLGLLAPVSSVIEGITTIGFFAFFAFLLALGIALLCRGRAPAEELLPTTAQ